MEKMNWIFTSRSHMLLTIGRLEVQLPSFDAYSTPIFLWAMNGIF